MASNSLVSGPCTRAVLVLTAAGACSLGCGAERPARREEPPVTQLELVAVRQALDDANQRADGLEARVAQLERLVLPEAREKDPAFGVEADWVSPVVGGAGGRSFSLSCAAGSFVTGLGGRAGSAIDRLGPVCQPLLAGAQGHGDPTQPGATGGSGGTLVALGCPETSVAIGLEGRAGAVVDAVWLVCAPVERAADGTLQRKLAGDYETTPEAGGRGGEAFSFMCPDGAAMTGLVGRSGAVLDSLAIACDPLAGR